MQLTIVLGASSEASFDIELYSTPFVEKWISELKWCVENCGIDQTETFSNFEDPTYLQDKIGKSVEIINSYLKGFIDVSSEYSREYLNYLHTRFEKISGGFGEPTRLFLLAPPKLKDAIHNLNASIHKLEQKYDGVDLWNISFNKNLYRRHKLEDSDYNNFVFDAPPGTFFLHYAELGKDYKDLYKDNLPINYQGLKNLHYYGGETALAFSSYNLFNDDKFIKWLESNNIDPYNKRLGHGKIPLGKIKNCEEVRNKLSQYRHIKDITLKD